MTAALEVVRTLRWYVRQLTGESKWDEYVAECTAFGEPPIPDGSSSADETTSARIPRAGGAAVEERQ